MYISDWSSEDHARLGRFVAWWFSKSADDSVKFPLDMESGEWDEQYRAWEE